MTSGRRSARRSAARPQVLADRSTAGGSASARGTPSERGEADEAEAARRAARGTRRSSAATVCERSPPPSCMQDHAAPRPGGVALRTIASTPGRRQSSRVVVRRARSRSRCSGDLGVGHAPASGRDRFGSPEYGGRTERGRTPAAPAIALSVSEIWRSRSQPAVAQVGVGEGVVAELEAVAMQVADDAGMLDHVLADHEEGRRDWSRCSAAAISRRPARVGAVVEGEGDAAAHGDLARHELAVRPGDVAEPCSSRAPGCGWPTGGGGVPLAPVVCTVSPSARSRRTSVPTNSASRTQCAGGRSILRPRPAPALAPGPAVSGALDCHRRRPLAKLTRSAAAARAVSGRAHRLPGVPGGPGGAGCPLPVNGGLPSSPCRSADWAGFDAVVFGTVVRDGSDGVRFESPLAARQVRVARRRRASGDCSDRCGLRMPGG